MGPEQDNDDTGTDETGEDRDEQRDDVDEPDDDDTDEGKDDAAEYKAPTREEWEKVQRTLARAKSERTKARAERDEARAALAAGKPPAAAKPKTDQDAGDDDGTDDGKDDGKPDDSRWRLSAARSSAAVQLSSAGFPGTAKQAKRLTVLLDLAGAEPDDDGDFDFEEAIDELKDEYPQLFAGKQQQEETAPTRRPRPTTADRGRGTDRDATSDPSKRTSAALARMAGLRPPGR